MFITSFVSCEAVVQDTEGLEALGKRLQLYPPSREDYQPLIQVIENQLSALRLKDIDRAYFYYTSKDFQKETSLPEFKRFVKTNSVLENNKSITLIHVQIGEDISYYKGEITSNKGGSRIIDYNLVLEYGEWKIHSMRFF